MDNKQISGCMRLKVEMETEGHEDVTPYWLPEFVSLQKVISSVPTIAGFCGVGIIPQ